jgi:hypothetical protein
LAPADRTFVNKFLPEEYFDELPVGYYGAPFIGTILSELLKQDHQVTVITTSDVVNNDYTVKKFTSDKFTWLVLPKRPHSFWFAGGKVGYMLDFFSDEQNFILNCLRDGQHRASVLLSNKGNIHENII